jgi:hypothetical protein
MESHKFLLALTLISFLIPTNGFSDTTASDYIPSNKVFWSEIQEPLKDSNYEKVIDLAESQMSSSKKDSLDYAEARLAQAMSLKHLNFAYGATVILGDLIKNKLGTSVAGQALVELEDISKNYAVDEKYVYGELLNDLEFDNISGPAQDFVAFNQGMFDLLKGFNKWSNQDFKKITPDSYWDYKLKYLSALGDVAHDHVDAAIDKFTLIVNSPTVPESIKLSAIHQGARLQFEKGDYPKAYKAFRQVKLNPREKGLILLERAWSKYYEKDYSKALGLLAALESPLFDTARSPEPYILKMLMYKELCYYNAAFNVPKEFQNRFGISIQKIRGRKDLKKDPAIVRLALLDQRLEKWADLLNQVKDEKSFLSDHSWDKYSFYKNLKQAYDLEITELGQRLDWLLQDKSREVANQLLDWQEQIVFLDYQTKLDSLRVIRPAKESDYISEEIPHLTFDRIYWVSEGEFWLDELESLKVFVKSRCSTEGLSQ